MPDIWFTSDTHWGHAAILKYCNRPYASVKEMDESLIRNWNAVVKPEDEVYHLGDFAFYDVRRATGIARRLNGNKFLIWGNHDHKRYRAHQEFLDEWLWTKDMAEITVKGRKIVLCHFPLMVWNKSHHGAWHIHGHCHGNLHEDPSALRVDAGIDCWDMAPVHIDEISKKMAMKQFKSLDHHGRDENA